MARTSEQGTRLHQLRVAVERQLLELMRFGRIAVDPRTGEQMRDEQGEFVRHQPSAADIQAAIKWLGMIGAASAGNSDPRSQTVQELVRRAKARALPAQDAAASNFDPDATEPYQFPATESGA